MRSGGLRKNSLLGTRQKKAYFCVGALGGKNQYF